MTLRFGVAGTGYWAREVHVRALQAMPGVRLVGMWGRNTDVVTTIAAQEGIAAFATLAEMLKAVDAVTIAVPPSAQPALAIEAANAGKHLLLEKPLGLGTNQAAAVVDAVKRNNVAAVSFLMRRFVPEIELAVLDAAQHSWTKAKVEVRSAAMSSATPYVDSRWRQVPGAALWDIGPHILSILVPVLGAITGVTANYHPGELTTFVTTHERGAQANVSLTLHGDPTATIRRYSFQSQQGALVLPEPIFSHAEAFQRAVADLLAVVAHPQLSHRCSVDFAFEIVRVLEAAQHSAHAHATMESGD